MDIQSDILILQEESKTFSSMKRGILSLLRSVYDALAFDTPCHCLTLLDDLFLRFLNFYCFNQSEGDIFKLDIFTNSSQVTYGTCVYFPIIEDNGIKFSFKTGKSCPAPLLSKTFKKTFKNHTKTRIAV